jgi:hypothetical protein
MKLSAPRPFDWFDRFACFLFPVATLAWHSEDRAILATSVLSHTLPYLAYLAFMVFDGVTRVSVALLIVAVHAGGYAVSVGMAWRAVSITRQRLARLRVETVHHPSDTVCRRVVRRVVDVVLAAGGRPGAALALHGGRRLWAFGGEACWVVSIYIFPWSLRGIIGVLGLLGYLAAVLVMVAVIVAALIVVWRADLKCDAGGLKLNSP